MEVPIPVADPMVFLIIFLYHSNLIPIDYVPTIFPFDSRNLPKNYSGIVATIPYFLSNVLRYRDMSNDAHGRCPM